MHFCIEIYDSEVTGKVRYRAEVYNRYIPMWHPAMERLKRRQKPTYTVN